MIPDLINISSDLLYGLDSIVDLGQAGVKAHKVISILKELGYLKDSFKSTIITPQVTSATRKFQTDLGLNPTGTWTPELTQLVKVGQQDSSIFKPVTQGIDHLINNNQSLTTPTRITQQAYTPQVFTNKFSERKGQRFSNNVFQCYIINLNTNTRIEFGTEPDEVTDSKSNQYEDEQTLGRSSPFKGYFGSNARTVNFTLELCADYVPDGLITTCNRMKALCYPHKAGHIIGPKALFILGNFFKISGTPKDVGVTYKKPIRDGQYTRASVSFTIDEVEDQTRFASEVEQNG